MQVRRTVPTLAAANHTMQLVNALGCVLLTWLQFEQLIGSLLS
jgi:hypothetical protein